MGWHTLNRWVNPFLLFSIFFFLFKKDISVLEELEKLAETFNINTKSKTSKAKSQKKRKPIRESSFGVKLPALLPIPLSRIIIDVLHLEIRVSERFLLVLANSWIDNVESEKRRDCIHLFRVVVNLSNDILIILFSINRSAKLESWNGYLQSIGLPELELDEDSNLLEIKNLFNGSTIANFKKHISQIVSKFQLSQKTLECWNLFQEMMELAKKWEKGNSQSKVYNIFFLNFFKSEVSSTIK